MIAITTRRTLFAHST